MKENGLKTHPQFIPRTAIPFIKAQDELLLPGYYTAFIPKSVIFHFKFTGRINLKTNDVNFSYLYPEPLYGNNNNWPGWGFTDVFVDYNIDGNLLIFSFPVSHDLYISNLKSEKYSKVYAAVLAVTLLELFLH